MRRIQYNIYFSHPFLVDTFFHTRLCQPPRLESRTIASGPPSFNHSSTSFFLLVTLDVAGRCCCLGEGAAVFTVPEARDCRFYCYCCCSDLAVVVAYRTFINHATAATTSRLAQGNQRIVHAHPSHRQRWLR